MGNHDLDLALSQGERGSSSLSHGESLWLDGGGRLGLGGCHSWEHRDAFYKKLGETREWLYRRRPSLWVPMADPDEKRQPMVLRHLLSW